MTKRRHFGRRDELIETGSLEKNAGIEEHLIVLVGGAENRPADQDAG